MAVFFITAKHSFLLPHAYSININRAMAAGSSGYFIISVNISSTATTNHNVRVLGATIPVTFGYTTAPNLTDTLTNGGLKTIAASFAKTANSSNDNMQSSVNAKSNFPVDKIYPNPEGHCVLFCERK